MKTSRIFLRLLYIFYLVVSAQYLGFSQIDYSQYMYPDVELRLLDFSMRLGGNTLKVHDEDLNGFEYTNFNTDGFLNYNKFKNNRDLQQFTQALVNYNIRLQNREGTTSTPAIKEFYFSPSIRISSLKRRYKSNNKYFESHLGISSRLDLEILDSEDYSQYTFSPTFGFRLGKGRVEPASELFDAHFILDDLRDNGFAINTTQRLLFEFGQLIAKQRQRRVLDNRRQRVNQIEDLSKWLSPQIENFNDFDYIKTTMIITDNFLYNFFNDRAIGSRKSIGINGRYFGSTNNTTDLYQDNALLNLYAEVYKTYPVNQYFHKSWAVFAGARYMQPNIIATSFTHQQEVAPFINFVYRYSYHPNSRTELGLTGTLNNYFNIPNFVRKNNLLINPGLHFNTSYFINFQTRIVANFGFDYKYFANNSYFSPVGFLDHEIYGTLSTLFHSGPIAVNNVISNIPGTFLVFNIRFLHSFY